MASLRTQILVILLAATAPSVALMAHALSEQERIVRESAVHQSERLARQAAAGATSALARVRDVLLALGELDEMTSGDLVECSARLARVLPQFPHMTNIVVLDPSGVIRCSGLTPAEGLQLTDQGVLQRTLERPERATAEVIWGPLVQQFVVNVSTPLYDGAGRLVGVLAAGVRLEHLDRAISIQAGMGESSIVLVDAMGALVARDPPLPNLRGQRLTDSELVAAMMAQRDHGTELVGLDGVRRIYAFDTVSFGGGPPTFFVAAGKPRKIALDEVRGSSDTSLLALLLGVLLLVSASLVAVERLVVEPVSRIARAATQLGAGDLAVRTGTRGRGEVGQLAQAFDGMAEALERRTQEAKNRAVALEHAKEQLRALAMRLESAHESERRRLAREVHDVLGQMLTALKLDVAALKRRGAKQPPEALPEAIEASTRSLSAMLDALVDAVRRLARDLRPTVLDDLGLVAALEAHGREVADRSELKIDFDVPTTPIELPAELGIALFRIFQESLTNILRHAQATRVLVVVRVAGHSIELSVVDDGRGMSTEETRDSRGLGLLGMRERASLLGGSFDITGRPGRGTVVTVRLPLRPAPQAG
ncbi:histidine kinase [Myxococcota bacterium]|nr:histidine kinase [Myxococcota bacterium]